MAVSTEKLKTEINAILKDADLSVMSAKKVRQILEEKLNCDLSARKKEVDKLVMDYVNSKDNNDASESEDEEEPDSEEEERGKKNKRAAKKSPAKKRGGSSDESESGGDDDKSDDEYKPQKGKRGPKPKRKKTDSDEEDSDEDWKAPRKPPTKKSGGGGGEKKKGRGTGFTRPYTLSPELAALMGAEALPRHEVVKKIWAMIKERNLYDPKNKQYAICDNDLLKVMGVKRFRTFGMLKYLREHFLD